MHRSICSKKQDARVAELEAEVETLQQRLGDGIDAEKIAKRHIKLLHEFNEAKDAAQILIGKLANLKETTVRHIHEELDLIHAE